MKWKVDVKLTKGLHQSFLFRYSVRKLKVFLICHVRLFRWFGESIIRRETGFTETVEVQTKFQGRWFRAGVNALLPSVTFTCCHVPSSGRLFHFFKKSCNFLFRCVSVEGVFFFFAVVKSIFLWHGLWNDQTAWPATFPFDLFSVYISTK